MGQQTSSLNCKINEIDKNNQVLTTKQIAIKQNKSTINQQSQLQFPSQTTSTNLKSPKNSTKRSITEGIIFAPKPFSQPKTKLIIPEHECITKVSQFPFKNSIKQKRFYVEQKIKTLGQIIEGRYNTVKHFPYSQIIQLTQCLVYSLAYLARKKFSHHDFYPTNIYYINGRFKLINPLQIKVSAFQLTSNRQRFSFLAPQLIVAILQQKKISQIQPQILNKSDLFAIGMILLEICTLLPSSDCYDEQSYNIIDHVIKQRINKVSKIYTPSMSQLIKLILEYEVQERLDPIKLAQIVHSKIQNQKQIALQIQNQNRVMPQAKGPMPQQIMNNPNIQPQIVTKGPPLPPYSHQSFKMQNLNQNAIAVTVPNQIYSRISPNNQGFLSSSSLQQKLRVIELIKQNPNEQDSEGEGNHHHQQISLKPNQIYAHKLQNKEIKKQPAPIYPAQFSLQQKQHKKVQYPFVESIYRDTNIPLHEKQVEKFSSQESVLKRIVHQDRKPVTHIQFDNQQRVNLVIPQRQIRKEESEKIVNDVKGVNFVGDYQHQYTRTYGYSVSSDNQVIKNRFQIPEQVENDLVRQKKVELLSSPRNVQKQINQVKNSINLKKNENETLQQRVQRVLQMSRNVK